MAAAAPTVRVTVAPGRTVYHGPVGHPFRAGDALEIPADHAAALLASGHVHAEPAPAEAPAETPAPPA